MQAFDVSLYHKDICNFSSSLKRNLIHLILPIIILWRTFVILAASKRVKCVLFLFEMQQASYRCDVSLASWVL